MHGNKLRKFLVPTAVVAAITLSPPAWADTEHATGRAAASQGLTTGKVNLQDLSVGSGVPTDRISSNLAQAVDPETPGVTPGADSSG